MTKTTIIRGVSGYSGISGVSGYSGYSGISGVSGYSGYSGISGASGYSSYSGYSGISGYSSYSGISGHSGYSGVSGFSGYSGTSGFSAYSGYSGYSGVSGHSGTPGTGLVAKGPWVFESIYDLNDLVTYDGSAWLSLQNNNTENIPVEGVWWSLFSAEGTSGISGYSGSPVGGFLFHQVAPSTQWSVSHGLNYQYPVVTVWDSNDIIVYAYTITATDEDNLIINFNGVSVSGHAAISIGGESGASGYSGIFGQASGYSGHSGYSGISGVSGYSGISGVSGYSGISGVSGYSGSSGFSGYSGIYAQESGYSGYSGYSGIDGGLLWEIVSTGTNATSNKGYVCNTSVAGFTITLPGSPSSGYLIGIIDGAGTFETNNLTIARNGSKIMALEEDLIVSNNNASFLLVYADSTNGWRIGENTSQFVPISLSITAGKTLTVSKTITLTSPDDTSVITFPSGTNTLASLSGAETLSNKRFTPRVLGTTSSATPTINTNNCDIYQLTAQSEAITSFTTNLSGTPVEGDCLIIEITGTDARAITWGDSFESSTVALPTTTVTTAKLTVGFLYNDVTNKWRCVGSV